MLCGFFYKASRLLQIWASFVLTGSAKTACKTDFNSSDSHRTKVTEITNLPFYKGLKPVDKDHTTHHRSTMRKVKQFTIAGCCFSRVTMVWKREDKKIQKQWEGGGCRRERRKKKSHGIKQSEPGARQRSDCVAEWVILLHLLPQQGGCVCQCVCVGLKKGAQRVTANLWKEKISRRE